LPPSDRPAKSSSRTPLEFHSAPAPLAAPGPVSEEASFLEHRAALDATVLAPSEREELVLELHAGVLRGPL
jgi:hypothetical protein